MRIYLNGRWVLQEDAVVSVFDHGLLYGDGVFEGIRAYRGRVFRLEQHVDRLYRSARGIALEIPHTQAAFRDLVCQTVHQNGLREAYIRAVVTRGTGDLGLSPRKCPQPTVFIIASAIQLYPESCYRDGLTIITAATRRNSPDALDPQMKSLNYLNNILAKIEALNAQVEEALMLSTDGYVAECTGDNIFLVRDGVISTPPISSGILAGITRAAAMDAAAALGVPVREERMTLYNVYAADECFLTGTAAEVIPVVGIDGRLIGDGRVGRVTQAVMTRFHQMTETEGTPVSAAALVAQA